ncbi:MAG: FAD/NAD(P)-binding protein [Candidatus Ranarchaeia archaeon]
MSRNPLVPETIEVIKITSETPTVKTFRLRFKNKERQEEFSFKPGQYCMIGIPGYGSAPFGLASSPYNKEWIEFTIKKVGKLTNQILNVTKGQEILIRGPFGNSWPIKLMKGNNINVIAGGMGFPPIRSLLYEFCQNRKDYEKITLLYGSSSPEELVYKNEISNFGDFCFTHSGVRKSMEHLDSSESSYAAMVGPNIMMKNVCKTLEEKGLSREKIFVSTERMMKCGIGICGHCNIGGALVCRSGPIYSLKEILETVFIETPF